MSYQLFEQIAEWKLEAKSEDMGRYFYPTVETGRIEKGMRCYVIGRKGTGKTAISEYIRKQDRYNRFSEKLSFKNFPFNELYDQKDKRYTSHNQYMTLWKYIVYVEMARMMWRNENIDRSIRRKLDHFFKKEPKFSLARTISYWISGTFSLKILEQGGSVEASREIVANDTPWIERVRILEDMIRRYIDASSYYIVFDELDEDYKGILSMERDDQYIPLLTGLFRAVQDIRATFPSREYKIYPIVFLRDDIFAIMKDSDKTKWQDLIINLEWSPEKIKRLLAHRISRALDIEGPVIDFSRAWQQIFSTNSMSYKSERTRLSIFDYITSHTHIRPRDYIRYIQSCAEEILAQEKLRAGPTIVRKVDKSFSQYLRGDLEDEIYSILPEISQILDLFTYIGRPIFSFSDFEMIYSREIATDQILSRNTDSVLKTLFLFNVIGNLTPSRRFQIFRYLNKDSFLSFNQLMCVHRGLHKALQVF